MRFIIILDLQLLVRLQYLQLQEFWLVSRDHVPLSVGLGTKPIVASFPGLGYPQHLILSSL